MRICFYCTTVLEHGGGVEKNFISTARHLTEHYNAQIDIITMDENFSMKIMNLLSIYHFKKYDVSVFRKIPSDVIKNDLGRVNYIKCESIKTLIKALNNYEVIYSKNEILEAFLFKFLVGYQKIPNIVFGCHTSIKYPRVIGLKSHFRNFLYNSFIYKTLCSGVKAFQAVNSYDYEIVKHLFPSKRIYKIYNPFNFTNFISNSSKFDFDGKLSANKFKILWIGTFHKIKGLDFLQKLIKTINHDYKDKVEWVIVGDGQDKDQILNLASNNTNVNYLGYLKHELLPSLYSKCDLVISTSESESFSFTTIEANAMNKPVLAFPTNGQKDIIDQGVNGYLLESEDIYINTVKKAIDGDITFNDISGYIQRKFDEKKTYDQLISMLKENANA